ncbi:mitochondrial enolase superfamily member 1 [Grus japonensis]|uniref:Mitochondrial enolase superfamily member 1 n=1 Tax=Grus japonensis TaxID=30415 RepID=A0ABC9W9G1_GRUJA
MRQILFEALSAQVKEKVIWNSQYGFTTGKSCFSSFIALWNEMKRSVKDGRLVDTMNHYFSKYHVLSRSSSSRPSQCPCWGIMAWVVGLLDAWKNSKGSSHDDHRPCEERLKELGKGQIQGDPTAAYHYLQGGYQEDIW